MELLHLKALRAGGEGKIVELLHLKALTFNFTLLIKGILAVGDLLYFTFSRVFKRINTVLQIRRGKRDNLGIIGIVFFITLLKLML